MTETLEEKQEYLNKEIIQGGYDADDFTDFIENNNDGGKLFFLKTVRVSYLPILHLWYEFLIFGVEYELDNFTMEELRNIVISYKVQFDEQLALAMSQGHDSLPASVFNKTLTDDCTTLDSESDMFLFKSENTDQEGKLLLF